MDLTIDIGNSYTKICVFNYKDIVFNKVTRTIDCDILDEILSRYKVEKCIMSSVVDNKTDFYTYFRNRGIYYLEVTSVTPMPITNGYKTPHTLGIDRIAAAVGANGMSQGETSLIIDIGTCITYDIVNANNVYIGGNIAPGYKMRLDAMHAFTKRLPSIETDRTPNHNIGTSTCEAMQAGAYYGILYEIEGIINEIKAAHGKLNVYLTGGGAKFFADRIKDKTINEPNLIHYGLIRILNYNYNK